WNRFVFAVEKMAQRRSRHAMTGGGRGESFPASCHDRVAGVASFRQDWNRFVFAAEKMAQRRCRHAMTGGRLHSQFCILNSQFSL
ncbi:MAG: hypothetical protein ACK48C_08605, partial [Roseiflexaceae bacterium]